MRHEVTDEGVTPPGQRRTPNWPYRVLVTAAVFAFLAVALQLGEVLGLGTQQQQDTSGLVGLLLYAMSVGLAVLGFVISRLRPQPPARDS